MIQCTTFRAYVFFLLVILSTRPKLGQLGIALDAFMSHVVNNQG